MKFRNILMFVLLTMQILNVGCVGIGFSVPHSKSITVNFDKPVNLSSKEYFPRTAKSGETVVKRISEDEILYKSTEDTCFYFLFAFPAVTEGCQSQELWTYTNSNSAIVDHHSHRLFGLWCSPIPYLPFIATIGTSISGGGRFPFCEVHLGSELNQYTNGL